MESQEQLDHIGSRLLADLAHDPQSPSSREFDAVFYEVVWKYLRVQHRRLGARVSRYLGLGRTVAPQVLADEVDEVAHDATVIALRRVREHAFRFDPARGSPTKWLLGAAEFAYIEVAKEVVRTRRSDVLTFVDPEDLLERPADAISVEERVVNRAADADAFAIASDCLSDEEFAVLRLRVAGGYSRAEIAEAVFGDPTMTKRVDRTFLRAKAKVADAWNERPSGPGYAGSANGPDRGDAKEETDG